MIDELIDLSAVREKNFILFPFFCFVFFSSYFQDGLKTIEHFGSYITDLSQGLQRIRQKQDEERKQLADLRQLLKSSHVFDKEVSFLCQHLRKMYLTDSRVN